MQNHSKLMWGILVFYTVFIAYVSLAGGTTEETYIPDLNHSGIDGLDKLLHFLAYMIFAILSLLTFCTHKIVNVSYIGIILYSLVLELIQSLLPLREASAADFFANSLGVICVYLLQHRLKLKLSN